MIAGYIGLRQQIEDITGCEFSWRRRFSYWPKDKATAAYESGAVKKMPRTPCPSMAQDGGDRRVFWLGFSGCPPRAWSSFLLIFFQAEDGIRDLTVTGVQTCALPISQLGPGSARMSGSVLRAPEPMSTLDAELNDFGAQLAMLGGHAADSDG